MSKWVLFFPLSSFDFILMLFQSFAIIFFNNLKKNNELLSIDFTYSSNNGLPMTSDSHLTSVITPLLGFQN